MTSLISRMRDISGNIKDLESLMATEAEANAFKTRAEELSGLSGQIQQPVRRIQLFRQAGVPVEASYVHDNQLRLDLEAMAQEYAEDRKSIIVPNPEWRHATKNRLEGVARRSNQQLLLAWNDYVTKSRALDRCWPFANVGKIASLPNPVTNDNRADRRIRPLDWSATFQLRRCEKARYTGRKVARSVERIAG